MTLKYTFIYLGLKDLRMDREGKELPNARWISRLIVNPDDTLSTKYSSLLSAFGQFIDHDLMQTPLTKSNDGGFLNCSQCGIKVHFIIKHFIYRVIASSQKFSLNMKN